MSCNGGEVVVRSGDWRSHSKRGSGRRRGMEEVSWERLEGEVVVVVVVAFR